MDRKKTQKNIEWTMSEKTVTSKIQRKFEVKNEGIYSHDIVPLTVMENCGLLEMNNDAIVTYVVVPLGSNTKFVTTVKK